MDHWKLAYYALGVIPAVELSDLRGFEDLVCLYACGSISMVGDGAAVIVHKNQESAMELLKRAVQEGWYKGREGTLWRRLRECNIFYYNDYSNTQYQNNEDGIRQLKEKLGYPED